MLISTRIRTGRGNIKVYEEGPNKSIAAARLERKVRRILRDEEREARRHR